MNETNEWKAARDSRLRSLIKGKPQQQQLALIREETGLKNGREIWKLRELDKGAYNALATAPVKEAASGNARKDALVERHNFRFKG